MAISAAALRSQLITLTNSTGIHKEQADKYRNLLDQVLLNTGAELSETLKLFIEASKSAPSLL
jgi:COP9 signalosome complex subunit 4